MRNLPFGRRIEVSSLIRDDGKVFSKKKLPNRMRTLSVGVLVDESGSTDGPLIQASRTAAYVIEDFCRNMEIPHYILGYTTSRGGASIMVYSAPDEIDNSNRYRITGMQSRGGTPTATALCYMRGLMRKIDTDVRLIFVISDGGAGDNYGHGQEPPITRIMNNAKRDRLVIIACGIGSQRRDVEREFGTESFLDIADITLMPEQIINIIKSKLF